MTEPAVGAVDPQALATSAVVRVTYAEVDRMNVAYYGNYLRWFEIGRAEYLRARGKTYRQLEEEGFSMPVAEAHVRYRQPARYDDLLRVRTTFDLSQRVRLRFDYQVLRQESQQLLAEGYTVHACVGPSGRPGRIPAALLERLGRLPHPTR